MSSDAVQEESFEVEENQNDQCVSGKECGCKKTCCLMQGLIWLVAPLVAYLDQLTKNLVVDRIAEGEIIPVMPLFNLTLTYNKGIAFGILANLPESSRLLVINLATIVALITVLFFLRRHFIGDKIAYFAMALIVGGAIGNVIDRAVLGQVVDFIDVYYGQYHWPAFNVADSAVCVGVFLLLFRPSSEKSEAA